MPGSICLIEREDLQALLDAISKQGYQLLGPTIQNHAVTLDSISTVEDLPVGWTDCQDGGTYRIEKTDRPLCFDTVCGPQSWKKFLHPAEQTLWTTKREKKRFTIEPVTVKPGKRALIGVRSCDLHAIGIQDTVFLQGPYVDRGYQERRAGLFIVAVNCTRAGGTCFCASMNTGPKADDGFDLALTEVLDGKRHYFIAESGSKAGDKVMTAVPNSPAGEEEIARGDKAIAAAAASMGRTLDTGHLKETMYRSVEHPRWVEIARRCLSCCNCTQVCPTCFCTTVEDRTDLSGNQASRVKMWDSCFTVDFSYIYGGSIRPSPSARYRQWMMHKLAGWVDQFGTYGCVGCGRCITWCPVGIDITEEARILRDSEPKEGAVRSA